MPRFGSAISVRQMATPANPPAGTSLIYPKSDGKWYTKTGGTESLVGAVTPVIAVGLRQSVDQSLAANVYTSLGWNSVPYAQGDPSLTGNVLTFPTAGLYEMTFNCFTTSATARRQFRIETWTGSDPGTGSATTIAIDDRYIGGYASPTLVCTHSMAAGQKIRVTGWTDVAVNNWNSLIPARLDVKSV